MLVPELNEEAQRDYLALRDLIIHHHGGWLDVERLQKLRDLCRSMSGASHDAGYREKLRAIESYGIDLFSESAHKKWERKPMAGTDFLRLLMLNELQDCRDLLLAHSLPGAGRARNQLAR